MDIRDEDLIIISKIKERVQHKTAKEAALYQVQILKKLGTLPSGYRLQYVGKDGSGYITEEDVKDVEINIVDGIRDFLRKYEMIPLAVIKSKSGLPRFKIIEALRILVKEGEAEVINEKTGEKVEL